VDSEELKEVRKAGDPGGGAGRDSGARAARPKSDDRIVAPWFGWLMVAVAVALAIVVIWLKRA